VQTFEQFFWRRSHGGSPYDLRRDKPRLLWTQIQTVALVQFQVIALPGPLALAINKGGIFSEEWTHRWRRCGGILHPLI